MDAAFETSGEVWAARDKEHAIDSTIVRAQLHAAGVCWGIVKSGALAAARRLLDQIHLRTNAKGGDLLTFDVTGGEVHEVSDALMELHDINPAVTT